ncbi:MAG: dihydropteroate synthase [Deltaproteobacteria bacterium]|nr:dihydropteroate synthase [Deltaproteobacteria bacterium]
MGLRSKVLSRKRRPKARLLSHPDKKILIDCGVDPASIPILMSKMGHRILLLRDIKLYAANILKQEMLSIGGDVAVNRGVISGEATLSDCVVMGDLRHFRRLIDKLKLQPGLSTIASMIEDQVFFKRDGLILDVCGRHYRWDELPVVMGVLNVSDDSFSDGGLWMDPDKAYKHAMDLITDGAQIIDIGAESTRPGSIPIDKDKEISRVVPVIERIVSSVEVPISIDTQKSEVAKVALDAGACIVNDISGLRHDPDMVGVVKDRGAGVVLMHMRGTPQTMQQDTSYNDIITEIVDFLDERIHACIDAGIDKSRIIVDPGIGFGKDLKGNLTIIRHISEFKSLGVPVLLGHSRKAFIGNILGTPVNDREEGTDAVTAWAALQGVNIIRVHDVRHAMRIRSVIRSIVDERL